MFIHVQGVCRSGKFFFLSVVSRAFRLDLFRGHRLCVTGFDFRRRLFGNRFFVVFIRKISFYFRVVFYPLFGVAFYGFQVFDYTLIAPCRLVFFTGGFERAARIVVRHAVAVFHEVRQFRRRVFAVADEIVSAKNRARKRPFVNAEKFQPERIFRRYLLSVFIQFNRVFVYALFIEKPLYFVGFTADFVRQRPAELSARKRVKSLAVVKRDGIGFRGRQPVKHRH